MSNKEVKAALKSARDAIKNKEFKEALKHCKAVLKLEKNNYNAWVFIGLAASELEQPDQSQSAYKKAVELEPDQLLAWQGLANLYEKTDQWDFKVELPNVYQKLVDLYASSDKNKCYEVIKKLSDIYHSDKEYLKLAKVWLQLIQLKEEEAVDKKELLQLWRQMTQHLSDYVNEEEQDNETQQHLITAFEKSMVLMDPVPGEEHKNISTDYIKCLSKVCTPSLLSACETMLSLYPNKSYPLEVLCSHYLKTGKILEDAVSCFSRLLDLTPNSGLGYLGLGTNALQEGRYKDAVKDLAQGLKSMSCSTGWYKLAEAQFKMHRYSDSATSCSQGMLLYIAIVTKMTFTTIPDAEKDPVLLALKGRAYLNKGQIDQALKIQFSTFNFTLFALSLYSFLQAASQNPQCGEYYFFLGKLYWDMGEETRKDRSKAQTHLLKAAKLDPHLGCIFRYLGHYYQEVAKDHCRARGCYKKAFELDDDEESGAASVDLCMKQGDMDTALEILQSVIVKATPGSAKWAWMRRGLYYLKVGEHQQAIADLQAALRADPEDWVCWECLGEAYLNRRSFTAALKAFDKAHQLQPSSIYSVYQAAAIKQILGKFKEAVAEYLQITAQQDYVPALKGLGECQLSLAKSLMEDCRDGGAIDLIQQAIQNLFRAVELRPDLSCLWKLLGDACTAISAVSPNRAQVLVPAPLAGLDLHVVVYRCYARALKLMSEVPSLWYDLGLNYYRQACLPYPTEGDQNSLLLEKAEQCLKKAIMMDSANHIYWNALGVISMNKGLENFALAQHCFIKSIQAESNNVVAWTNLGALYLKKDNIELAHEAFKIAQSLEPLYVNCWIGQALIAERVGSYDTMDLFRHTTELSTHMEGVKGYAYWVCSTLLDKSNRDSELYRYNIVQMNAISAAQVALSKYTERIQSDSYAFIMLGYLNEHLQLKRQALQAYQRSVELLQTKSSTEELAFALSSYGRALCTSGQWEEAVHVYKSTPLQDLSDLAGLALAYCREGLIPDSVNAYERALAVASSEKEKAYILTALALLQHRQVDSDVWKTTDSNFTSTAALTELLKQGSASGSVVEQRCLLTCTLLALQGNYSAVQREASRAVHSNPGNPSLWALLSRVVPQYYPKKANGGAMAGHVACLSSMTQGKRALLYSGVNQLASGRHSGEDRHWNALKTMQRAVLLCPDDPAAWAGLMAACHTENTSCYLSGSAPCRQGLEQILMSVVSEKGAFMERPLAQSLEGWVLQQAVTGLMMGGQLEQAEALCTQVLNVSPEHPTVMLSLRQVQCQRLLLSNSGTSLPDSVLEQLNNAVMMNPTNLGAWHWLAEVYRSQGLLVQAVMAYRQSLQLASQLSLHSSQVASLLRLALLALVPCMAGLPGNDWKDLVAEATTEVLKLGSSPVALLFQALLQYVTKMAARETRRLLERLVYVSSQDLPVTVVQVASWYLLRHLHGKNDQELINALLQHAKMNGDQRLLEFNSLLASSSS
uniref:Tetratricopeptide repeat domain 37 n=1 Tax=Anabas testudineus TaxID=64144 RepID=A0A7N6A4L9_ANATE